MKKVYIDYLRTLGVLAVITTHVTVSFYSDKSLLGSMGWWLADLLNAASRFAVPLFVMISGALLLGVELNVVEFYRRRLNRLLPPLIVWSGFYLLFQLFQGVEPAMIIWKLKIGMLLSGNAAPHLWYLSMIIGLMLFVPFINALVLGRPLTRVEFWFFFGWMLLLFSLNQLSLLLKTLFSVDMDWFKQFPWYIAYLVLGYFIDQHSDKWRLSNRLVLSVLVGIVAIGSLLNYGLAAYFHVFDDALALSNSGPGVLLIAGFIFYLAKANASKLVPNRAIELIAEASFGIYLLHPVFVYLLKQYTYSYINTPAIYIPLAILASLIASLLVIMLMRKSQILRRIC